jgi:hypothetical protein
VRGLDRIPDAQAPTKPGRLHPRAWAAWVLSGDPGELPPPPAPAAAKPDAVVAPPSAGSVAEPVVSPAPVQSDATADEPAAPVRAQAGLPRPWLIGGASAAVLGAAGLLWHVRRRRRPA